MKTFPSTTYIERRKSLKEAVGSGVLLFLGNGYAPMNYQHNTYPFRQDSCFLYYFGLDVAGLNAVIDIDNDTEIVFGDELTMEDIVWTGALPSIKSMAESVGVTETKPSKSLEKYTLDRNVHYLPPYRHRHKIQLTELLGKSLGEIDEGVSKELIVAIIEQRNIKSQEEIEQLEISCGFTSVMHQYVMSSAKTNIHEYDLVAKAYEKVSSFNTQLSFPCILTKNGQTLHNHYHNNLIQDGDLVLFDGGVSSLMHYAGDMTRTFPANGVFSQKQKEIYNIVLDANVQCIESLRPGLQYKDAHMQAAKIIFSGLKDLGLTKGDVDEAVAAGAHTLFFQHGLGHMMGLDVHDMENLGENLVGYEEKQQRSEQFGTRFLRLARTLKTGNVVTVEPGMYFIPQLIDQWKAEDTLSQFINYDVVATYKDFGGIRIEDDVLITETGSRILGTPLAKTVGEVEAVIAD